MGDQSNNNTICYRKHTNRRQPQKHDHKNVQDHPRGCAAEVRRIPEPKKHDVNKAEAEADYQAPFQANTYWIENFASHSSIIATRSPISQRRESTPAAWAGLIL